MEKIGVLAEPVLVGRERELEEPELLLNSQLKERAKRFLSRGEAGSGKPRLAAPKPCVYKIYLAGEREVC